MDAGRWPLHAARHTIYWVERHRQRWNGIDRKLHRNESGRLANADPDFDTYRHTNSNGNADANRNGYRYSNTARTAVNEWKF